jgi:hypothetical protein
VESSFAIVGTAGRGSNEGDDGPRLTKHHFEAMCECARGMVHQLVETSYGVDVLVSGGAAWADHCAVRLFLNKEVSKLRLHFPCKYDIKTRQFDPAPLNERERQRGYTTGETINRLHRKFTRKVGFNSLTDISIAIERGAEIHVHNGFYARNAKVAEADVILAMTFGEREYLKDGGTSHCMKCYLNRVRKNGSFDKSFHYDLNSGDIFIGAKVRSEEVVETV